MQHIPQETFFDFFDTTFSPSKESLFKGEMRQHYNEGDALQPAIDAWQQGDIDRARHLQATLPEFQNYIKIRKSSAANRTRVHAVSFPLSMYLRFEIEVVYFTLITSGAEDIGLANKATMREVKLPQNDFWVRDDEQVLSIEYDHLTLNPTGATLYEGTDAEPFLIAKAALLTHSRPVEYNEHGQWTGLPLTNP